MGFLPSLSFILNTGFLTSAMPPPQGEAVALATAVAAARRARRSRGPRTSRQQPPHPAVHGARHPLRTALAATRARVRHATISERQRSHSSSATPGDFGLHHQTRGGSVRGQPASQPPQRRRPRTPTGGRARHLVLPL